MAQLCCYDMRRGWRREGGEGEPDGLLGELHGASWSNARRYGPFARKPCGCGLLAGFLSHSHHRNRKRSEALGGVLRSLLGMSHSYRGIARLGPLAGDGRLDGVLLRRSHQPRLRGSPSGLVSKGTRQAALLWTMYGTISGFGVAPKSYLRLGSQLSTLVQLKKATCCRCSSTFRLDLWGAAYRHA